MDLPTLSVTTPSFNSAEFLEDALLSVARQQRPCIEHVVVDCVSTDNTVETLKRFPQVQWISEPDKGQSDAINKGFLRATGDLMGWLNADDYYLPGGLEAIAHAAANQPEADVIYGDCVFVDTNGRIVRSKVEHAFDPAILMYFGCYIPSTSTFIRRRVIDSGLLLNCDYHVCMDFEYYSRLAHAGCKFHYVPRFVAAFRWHGCNVSLTQADKRSQERREVQRRLGECQHSPSTMKFLADAHRAKRLLRKVVSGNIIRELRVRQLVGRDTRWQYGSEGSETCATLACL
jgi:glycosyltransferase involved in cell wall biosynthesis